MTLSAAMKRLHRARKQENGVGYLDQVSGRPAVPHGLRSTFRDWISEKTSYPGDMAEVALAHKLSSSVEAAYRRGDMLEKRRLMMQAWSDFVNNSPTPENVLSFPVRFSGKARTKIQRHTPVERVVHALEKEIRCEFESVEATIENYRNKGEFPTSSHFLPEDEESVWSGPDTTDIISGIAFHLFISFVAQNGDFLTSGEDGQHRKVENPNLILFQINPTATPTAIRSGLDACSFAETPSLPLIDNPSNWLLRERPWTSLSPELNEAFGEAEIRRAERLHAGRNLCFQSSRLGANGLPIPPSQVAQNYRNSIRTIVTGEWPRSNSVLRANAVSELSILALADAMSAKEVPLSWVVTEVNGKPENKQDRKVRSLRRDVSKRMDRPKNN